MTVAFAKQQKIEGLTVFGDDSSSNVFYVMPDQPRYYIDPATKKPVMKLVKYKNPVVKPDGSKGGGFFVFASEFVVADATLQKIQSALDSSLSGQRDSRGQAVKAVVKAIPFTSAKASVTLMDTSGQFVTKIDSTNNPSLLGAMRCSFSAELTAEGATLMEATLKGSGGVVTIAYDLMFPAALPPMTGKVVFDAVKSYSFVQSIDKSGASRFLGLWDIGSNTNEVTKLREQFTSASAGSVDLELGNLGYLDAATQKTVHDEISNWAWGQVDDAVKETVLPAIAAATDRGDDGMDHISKTQTELETASFVRTLSERLGQSFPAFPNGVLPNLKDMGFNFNDFYSEVDLDDPFFKTIDTPIHVEADFARFNIDSVTVHCEYDKVKPPIPKDFIFKSPDDIGEFLSETANGDMSFNYSFAVNYKDSSIPYKAGPIATNSTCLVILGSDLGVLHLDLLVGVVDFTKVTQIQVAVKYPDTDASGKAVGETFIFDTNNKSAQWTAPIMKPVTKTCQYQATFILPDGSHMVGAWTNVAPGTLIIDSPLVPTTYSFLAEGDFSATIDNIFLKMAYDDPSNKMHQESDFTFTTQNKEKDWVVSTVSGGKGQVTYSGVISYKDHTTENIGPVNTTNALITFGPPNQVIISVQPDVTLIDFTAVKLIKVDFEYTDPAHQLDLKKEMLLKPGVAPDTWTIYARDPKVTSYTWTQTFYMGTTPPTVVHVPPATISDTSPVLMMPS